MQEYRAHFYVAWWGFAALTHCTKMGWKTVDGQDGFNGFFSAP